jgi:hypothetical protein
VRNFWGHARNSGAYAPCIRGGLMHNNLGHKENYVKLKTIVMD